MNEYSSNTENEMEVVDKLCVCLCCLPQVLMWRLWSIRTSVLQCGTWAAKTRSVPYGATTSRTHKVSFGVCVWCIHYALYVTSEVEL